MKTNAIIAGTGVNDLFEYQLTEAIIDTEYGAVTVYYSEVADFFFLNRHGANYQNPPHRINYKANLTALKKLGVKNIMALFAVGSINSSYPPGSIFLLNDFIDYTSGRDYTFFNGGNSKPVYTDMSIPFSPELGLLFSNCAQEHALNLIPNSTYICTDGPRLETPAEIRMFKQLNADVVGMTCVPEVILARELELKYAGIALSINWAAGIKPGPIHFVDEDLDKIKRDMIKVAIITLNQIHE